MPDLAVAQQISDSLRGSVDRFADLVHAMKVMRGEYASMLTRLSAARDLRKAKKVRDRIADMPEKNNATE